LAVGCILLTLYHVCVIFSYMAKRAPVCGAVAETDAEVDQSMRTMLAASNEGTGAIGSEGEEIVNPKYMHEATFWITDLPRLQNLSTLRLLAFAHPNLLVKRQKHFSTGDELARAVLEGVFRCNGKYFSDDQLSDEVAKVISQNGKTDNKFSAEELLRWRPSDALRELRAWREAGNQLDTERYNPEMLDKAWRMDLLLFGELLCFCSLTCICFTLGTVEFFHKICRLTLLLTDEETPLRTCMTFFLLFLNQTLGMMHINSLLQWRVETFIFGGTDAAISGEENYMLQVYLGLLMERIWALECLSTCEKLAIMLQLDDDEKAQQTADMLYKESPSAEAAKLMILCIHGMKLYGSSVIKLPDGALSCKTQPSSSSGTHSLNHTCLASSTDASSTGQVLSHT